MFLENSNISTLSGHVKLIFRLAFRARIDSIWAHGAFLFYFIARQTFFPHTNKLRSSPLAQWELAPEELAKLNIDIFRHR